MLSISLFMYALLYLCILCLHFLCTLSRQENSLKVLGPVCFAELPSKILVYYYRLQSENGRTFLVDFLEEARRSNWYSGYGFWKDFERIDRVSASFYIFNVARIL